MLSKVVAAGAALLWARAQAAPINGPLPQDNVVDYVIVGGGASALTVANRLTEDPDITVLVIETGQADDYQYQVMVPAFQGQAGFDPATGACGWFNWCDQTVPQVNLNNRPIIIPQGLGLGGGTIINGLLWNRGDQADFNDWATLGNQDWDWDGMLPYFKRSETFHAETDAALAAYYGIGGDASFHGDTGPQNVSFPNFYYNVSNYVFSAMKELNIPVQTEPNNGMGKGAMFLPQAISDYNQSRADARRARYDTAADRPNFYVSTGQRVHRIIWDGACAPPADGQKARALGVEVSPSADAPTWTAVAKREVIMAAGAIRTPQVLELSGVGAPPALEAGGVQLKITLPGVGNNLQDHALMTTQQVFDNQDIVYPNILQNETLNAMARDLYYANRTGPWTNGPPDGNAFISLPQYFDGAGDLANTERGYTDDQYLLPNLDPAVVHGYSQMRPLLNAAITADDRAAIEYLNTNNGQMQISNMRPFSRGGTHIANNDPFGNPNLDYNYIASPVDYTILIQALHLNDNLFNTDAMGYLQPEQRDPVQHADDNALNDFLRNNLGTEYHPAGTAAMLPLDSGGVVDPTLLMYYTTNVRIIDASMQPMIPAAHLQSVVYAVAERAADIIKAAQQNEPGETPTLPLDTTSCNVDAASKKKRHVAGPHEYTAEELRPMQKRQLGGQDVKTSALPPMPRNNGMYPDYNQRARVPARVGQKKAASEGLPEGAALRYGAELLGQLAGNLTGGILDGVGGLLKGQGPIGL